MVGGNHAGERLFNGLTIAIMILLMIMTVYPFWFSVISSFNSGGDLLRGPVFLWPREFTFASWKAVLSDQGILYAAWITASRTVIVTAVSILYTSMFAYAFSRPYLRRKAFYITIGFISMYFSGGLIPSYMLMNWLGLYDSYWVYILPVLFGGFWNVIIFNANYKGIPEALFESAKMDGSFSRLSCPYPNRYSPHYLCSQLLTSGTTTGRRSISPNPRICRRCNI
ncbi:Lactose transport system permease protein LacG [compost metagenome]